jgi:hypothetical protein
MTKTMIACAILTFGFCLATSPAFPGEPIPDAGKPSVQATPKEDTASAKEKKEQSPKPVGKEDKGESASNVEPGNGESPEKIKEDPDASPKPADPFAFGPVVEGEDFLPTSRAQVPAGIRVVAILHVKGKKPLAVLDIPGSHSGDLHYVREGDVIQIDAPAGANPQPRIKEAKSSPGGDSGTAVSRSTEHFYILISKISANQVEVAPRTRPQEARILR